MKARFTNPDNYTADKIDKIIVETVDHYFPCSSIVYTQSYYYRCDTCSGRQKECIHQEYHEKEEDSVNEERQIKVRIRCPRCPSGGVSSDHEHDYGGCGIRLCSKEESECSGNYNFNIYVKCIEVEDAEYWNQVGTNKTNFRRGCQSHNYYLYIYKGEDLLESICLYDEKWELMSEEEIRSRIEGDMAPIDRGAYTRYYITDRENNQICEIYKTN